MSLRSPLLLLLALGLAAVETPVPGLPPVPRTLQLNQEVASGPERTIDASALGADIDALRRSVRRVEAALGEAPSHPAEAHAEAHGHAADPHAAPVKTVSDRYGEQVIGFGKGLEALITANIAHEQAELVLKELISVSDVPFDDIPLSALRRPVTLRLDRTPLPHALDHLLGQIGLGWRSDGHGGTFRIRVIEGPLSGDDAEAASVRALERAAAEGDSPVAAEAHYLLGARELKAHRPLEAIRRFETMVVALAKSRDPETRRWVQRSFKASADAMMELGEFENARGVYRNYISRSEDETDPDLPRVYLSAAEAGRRLGLARKDPVAFDEAADDLHTLLERFGNDKDRPEIPIARLMIGGLLYDQGRWQEAETQLRLWSEAAGKATDQVAWWLASCAFEQGRFEEARAGYDALHRAWKAGHQDGQAPETVYETAAYRIGLCSMRLVPSRYVHALFAFQRAQADFPKSALSAELTVNIARCYAEIEREDDAVAQLTALLSADGGGDVQDRLDTLVGHLLGRLGDYPGPVRARVMFYIAQATARRAERAPKDRAVLAAQAVGWYERTLNEQPSDELKDAARLGLARAAFLAGDADRGELELRTALADPTIGERDRAFAGRMLGDWYRQQGRLPEAVKAYRGIIE